MQLSPTAESFTPVGVGAGFSNGSPNRSLSHYYTGACYPASSSHVDTIDTSNRSIAGPVRHHGEGSMDNEYTRGSQQTRLNLSPSAATAECFDELEIRSRAFVIEGVPTNLSYMSLAGFFNVRILFGH